MCERPPFTPIGREISRWDHRQARIPRRAACDGVAIVDGAQPATPLTDSTRLPAQTSAAGASQGTAVSIRPRLWNRFRWLTRPRRILLLLGAVWVLNVFDLGYTVLEATRHSFVEMNPVAAPLLAAPTYVLVIYKAALVAASSALLLVLRRHRVVEVGCWFLLAVYSCVAGRWILYYNDLMETINDPAVNIPRLAG